MLSQKASPAIQAVTGATIPGQEFAPGGPSPLQQQAFGLAEQLPGFQDLPAFQADPASVQRQFQPIADFARQGFQEETIPAIAGAAGFGGTARSSGFRDILARQGRNLELGLGAQLAGFQQGALGRQAQLPGIAGQTAGQVAGLGGLQQSFPEAQRQFGLRQFLAGSPEQDPRLGFIGPAFTSPFDTAVQQGFSAGPGLGSQLIGPAATLGGAKILVACITEGTIIDTPEGDKSIQDIRAGDTVIGKDGSGVTVLWKYEFNEPPTSDRFIELTFSEAKITVCDMHKIDGIRAKDMRIGEKGLVSKKFIEMNKRSYDLLTTGIDGGYRSQGIPLDSMIPELLEVAKNLQLRKEG